MGRRGRQEVPDLNERGSLTVEAALVLPLVLLVLLASVELSAGVATQLELVAAAREGARVAATAPDPALAVERARSVLGPELAGRSRIAVRRPSVVGSVAEIRIELAKPLVTPLLRGFSLPLRARAAMRVER